MKLLIALSLALFTITLPLLAGKQAAISGDYLEVRTCNVYVGTCVANGEMGLTGKEAILVWSVRHGVWKNTPLSGLKVIAVVTADDTLGDQHSKPVQGKAILVVDERANPAQKEALVDLARALGGKLTSQIVEVQTSNVDVAFDTSAGSTCTTVKAGKVVEISTFGISGQKTPCGNEQIYYPPLTEVNDARAGFTALAAYYGSSLSRKWEAVGLSSAYVGKFSR